MNCTQRLTRNGVRSALGLGLAVLIVGMPATLGGCDKRTDKSTTTTTKTTDTPEGTKQTTEKTERKVETTPKPQ